MTQSVPGAASDFNTEIIEEFRANRGRVGGPFAATPMNLGPRMSEHVAPTP